MNNQEAFNIVWNHAKRMKKRSSINTNCLYRGPNGNKCFIGILIPDDEYDSDMEGCTALELFELDNLPNTLFGLDMYLLEKLQDIHDNHEYWSHSGFNEYGFTALRALAHRYKLIVPQ